VVDEDNEVSEIEMLPLLEVRERNERGNCMHTWLREMMKATVEMDGVLCVFYFSTFLQSQ